MKININKIELKDEKFELNNNKKLKLKNDTKTQELNLKIFRIDENFFDLCIKLKLNQYK